jgi:hypothetical protein
MLFVFFLSYNLQYPFSILCACCFNDDMSWSSSILIWFNFVFISNMWSSLVSFLSLGQNTWDDQLVRRKDSFWITVSEASVHGHWSCHFGPVTAYCIMAGAHSKGNLFISWWSGSKETNRKGQRSRYPFHGYIPNDLTSYTRPPSNSSVSW